jgi:hypothetical protein
MMTSDVPGKAAFEGDVKLTAHAAAGLDHSTIIRPAKIAALDVRFAENKGELNREKLNEVLAFLCGRL